MAVKQIKNININLDSKLDSIINELSSCRAEIFKNTIIIDKKYNKLVSKFSKPYTEQNISENNHNELIEAVSDNLKDLFNKCQNTLVFNYEDILESQELDNTIKIDILEEILAWTREILEIQQYTIDTLGNNNIGNQFINPTQFKLMLDQIAQISNKVQEQNTKIERIEDKVEEVEEKVEEVEEKIEKIEDYLIQKIEEKFGYDRQTMENIIYQTKTREAEEQKIQNLLQDEYNSKFYDVLVNKLNATYFASLIIQTDIVANKKLSPIGKFGTVLHATGSQIPLVGTGLSIAGFILQEGDRYNQGEIIKNFSQLVRNPQEMDALSRSIAIDLIENGFQNKLNHHRNSESTINQATRKISDISKQALNKLLDKDTITQAESDALFIGDSIISKVFSKEYGRDNITSKIPNDFYDNKVDTPSCKEAMELTPIDLDPASYLDGKLDAPSCKEAIEVTTIGSDLAISYLNDNSYNTFDQSTVGESGNCAGCCVIM